MTKKPMINNISEMVMATQDKGKSAEMSAMMKAGLLRKIAPKVYTTNMEDTLEDIIRRNIFFILGQLYPQAVISHRSAFALKPTAEGNIYLTYTYTKNVALPGNIEGINALFTIEYI